MHSLKVANIVPTAHLGLIDGEPYHMTLAHLLADDPVYREFYTEQARRGSHIVMDNGVVETGTAMPMNVLLKLAKEVGVDLLILPDAIGDTEKTLELGLHAFRELISSPLMPQGWLGAMLVPQGETLADWSRCAQEMSSWTTSRIFPMIGLSKFTARFSASRKELLRTTAGEQLVQQGRWFHLLGCASTPTEILEIACEYPHYVYGVDSGVAAIATQLGTDFANGWARPDVALDFAGHLNDDLLRRNLLWWTIGCTVGRLTWDSFPFTWRQRK